MSQYRDLMALQRQVDRLQRVKKPPTLRMVRIFDESRPEEPIGEYTLTYKIEPPLDWHKKQLKTEQACAANALAAVIPQFPGVFCWFQSQLRAPIVQVEHLCAFGVEKIQKTRVLVITCAEAKNCEKLMPESVTQLHPFM